VTVEILPRAKYPKYRLVELLAGSKQVLQAFKLYLIITRLEGLLEIIL